MLETFTEIKKFVENPSFPDQRRKRLAGLANVTIDLPIVGIINRMNRLHHCFTLQSCYGHFVHNGQKNPHNLELLPNTDSNAKVEYRIAYIAFCIDNNASGRGLFRTMKEITTLDPENIQFCCAEWFWKRQVNSYVLQVEPDRFKHQDKADLDYKEALHIEKTRNAFFDLLDNLFIPGKGG